MEVTDSDHKPVWALLTVDMPVVIQDRKREVCCRLLQQAYAASAPTAEPRVEVSASDVRLHQVGQVLRLAPVVSAQLCVPMLVGTS